MKKIVFLLLLFTGTLFAESKTYTVHIGESILFCTDCNYDNSIKFINGHMTALYPVNGDNYLLKVGAEEVYINKESVFYRFITIDAYTYDIIKITIESLEPNKIVLKESDYHSKRVYKKDSEGNWSWMLEKK